MILIRIQLFVDDVKSCIIREGDDVALVHVWCAHGGLADQGTGVFGFGP